jgi:hypothetical protein
VWQPQLDDFDLAQLVGTTPAPITMPPELAAAHQLARQASDDSLPDAIATQD